VTTAETVLMSHIRRATAADVDVEDIITLALQALSLDALTRDKSLAFIELIRGRMFEAGALFPV
jgi:hypothetical protein